MAQVTLSVPNENLPVLNDFSKDLTIENKNLQNKAFEYSYKVSDSLRESAKHLFNKYFSWEYFSNELEFE